MSLIWSPEAKEAMARNAAEPEMEPEEALLIGLELLQKYPPGVETDHVFSNLEMHCYASAVNGGGTVGLLLEQHTFIRSFDERQNQPTSDTTEQRPGT